MSSVISAISTAHGTGGVAIIRISGDDVISIAERMFFPLKKILIKDFEPYKMYVGEIDGGNFKDYGMAVYFKGPKSYTGEDMIEFHCHGGLAITQGILKRTFELGCIPASKGEFTKRAFINGKLSLDSAEGLIDMINSESIGEIKAGYYLYREKLNKVINELQNDLTYALAQIDANIDYPEEGLEEVSTINTKKILISCNIKINELINKYSTGRKIKNGVKVALIGKPNSGKSSLLNALLDYDKAIVSSIPGTTRDIVEGIIEIKGINFIFYDTAGIRESENEIELIGINRSKSILKSADIIVYITENQSDEEFESQLKGCDFIKIYNKSDIHNYKISGINEMIISAKEGYNIDEFKNLLYNKVFQEKIDLNADFLTEERHLYALKKSNQCIVDAINTIDKVPLDMVSIDIKKAWEFLGEITGKTANEQIINEIFNKFCVGK